MGRGDSYLVRKDERELELVADGLGVATTSAELGERAGSLGGAKSGSESSTSNHVRRMNSVRRRKGKGRRWKVEGGDDDEQQPP